eukprot:427742-Prorocentrum_minimum.AAC.1
MSFPNGDANSLPTDFGTELVRIVAQMGGVPPEDTSIVSVASGSVVVYMQLAFKTPSDPFGARKGTPWTLNISAGPKDRRIGCPTSRQRNILLVVSGRYALSTGWRSVLTAAALLVTRDISGQYHSLGREFEPPEVFLKEGYLPRPARARERTFGHARRTNPSSRRDPLASTVYNNTESTTTLQAETDNYSVGIDTDTVESTINNTRTHEERLDW